MQVKLSAKEKIKVLSSADLYKIMQQILLRENKIDRNKEHFWIIGLSQRSKILYIELISLGTVTATLVEPMEVFSIALQKRSVQIVLIHNHPSGETTPGEKDKDLTDRLIQIGRFLKVPVTDHLIITEKLYYSFRDTGLLAELEESKRYGIPYKEKERLQKEAAATAKQNNTEQIARQLKAQGLPISAIAQATGLSEAAIKKLRASRK